MTHVRRLSPLDHHLDRHAANAAALAADALVFDHCLEPLEEAEELLELDGRPEPLHTVRACMALLRSLRNDKLDLAARHQAAGAEDGHE